MQLEGRSERGEGGGRGQVDAVGGMRSRWDSKGIECSGRGEKQAVEGGRAGAFGTPAGLS